MTKNMSSELFYNIINVKEISRVYWSERIAGETLR